MKKITLFLTFSLLLLSFNVHSQVSSFSDDFSSGDLSNWTLHAAGDSSTQGWIVYSGAAYHEDDSGNIDNYLIGPLLDLSGTGGDATLTYDEYQYYSCQWYTSHTVVYSTDYDGSNAASATWTQLREGCSSGTSTTVNLDVPNTATAIAFRYQGNYSDDWAIDNVSFEAYSSCSTPSQFTSSVSDFSFGSATISWTAGNGNDEYSYSIYAGTDTTVAPVTTGTTSTESANLTNLDSNQLYTAVVTATCSGSSSGGTLSGTFTTNHVITGATTEDFSGYTFGNYAFGEMTAAGSWYTPNQDMDFVCLRGGTFADSSQSFYVGASTGGTDGTASDYFYSGSYNGSSGDSSYMLTPYLDVTSMTNPRITIDYHMHNDSGYAASVGDLTVTVMESDGTETDVISLSGAQQDGLSSAWQTAYGDLSSFMSEEIRIKITATYGGAVNFDDFTVKEGPSGQWTGTVDSDWSNASNWQDGNVPDKDTDVTLPSSATHDADISNDYDASVRNITIDDGHTLSINKGTSLTVYTDFTNNNSSGGVELHSESDGFSSLIVHGTATGNVIYNRYVNSVENDEWDLVGSPVSGLLISDFVTSNSGTLATSGSYSAVGIYDNETDSWENYSGTDQGWQSTTTGFFELGRGYQMATVSGATLTFTGSVASSDQTYEVYNYDGNVDVNDVPLGGRRWNLVSNPFPSYVNATNSADSENNFLKVNLASTAIDSEFGAVYAWNGTDYTEYGHDDTVYIAPGQAFMVAAASASAVDLSMAAATRTVTGTDDFIQEAGDVMDATEVYLRVYNGDALIEDTHIKFQDNMTLGLDPGYDLGNFYQGAAISTRLLEEDQGTNFAHQQLPIEAMDNAVIPLVINQAAGQEFRINLHTATIPDPNVYLEDVEEGTFTNLYEGDFVMTPESDLSGAGRFFIHMSADTMSNEDVSTSLLNAYKEIDASYITIEGLATQSNETKVSLYNILGREVLSTTLDNNMGTQTISTVGLSAGIYVIELESGTDRLTKKLVIK